MPEVPAISPPHRRQDHAGFNEATFAWFGAAVLLIGAVLWAAWGGLTEKTDFSLTYVAAYIVHHGQGSQLYDLAKQREVRDSLFQHPNPLIYEHPPFEAMLFAPLARLPYRTAYLLWGLVNVAIWLALPFLLRPYAPAPKEALAYYALWLIFAPLGVALFQGQSSLVLLGCYLLSYIQLKRGHDFEAGLFLGFGLFKFQFVLPIVLIFLLRAKWKFLRGFTCTTALLAVVSLFAVGWHGVLSYVHLLAAVGSDPSNLSYGSAVDMPTLYGFVYAMLGQRLSASTVSVVVAVISIGLLLLVAWRWRRQEGESRAAFDLFFAAALTVALMCGSHMFTHDFSPLVLALFLACAHFPERGRTALRWLLGVTLTLFWTPPLYFALVSWHLMYLMFTVLLAFAILMFWLAEHPLFHLEGNGALAK